MDKRSAPIYQWTIPYAAWIQAFSRLVNSWLAESETVIDQWRAAILEAVSQNGQVLIDVIPNLEATATVVPEVWAEYYPKSNGRSSI